MLAALPGAFYDDSLPFPAPGIPYVRTAGDRIITTKDGMPMVLVGGTVWIDAHPVTNAVYQRYLDEARPGASIDWNPLQKMHGGKDDASVVWVSRLDALRYAAWAEKRLPTAIELAIGKGKLEKNTLKTRYDRDKLNPFAAPHIGLRMAV